MSKTLDRKIRAAVIGASESGKTELVISFSVYLWKHYKMRSLVFDPWLKENPKRWGAHSWATDEMAKFEHVVFSTKGCCVVWDEATTNGGRDRDKTRFFTEVRHNHPVLFALGHCFSAFLPVMRTCLTDLHLALDDREDAEEWSKVMKDEQVMQATKLKQYEFLHKRSFQPVRVARHSLADLRAGVEP